MITDRQFNCVLTQSRAGTPVPALCREQGISAVSLYKWHRKSGGMDASTVSYPKELQDEKRRLTKMYAEAQSCAGLCR